MQLFTTRKSNRSGLIKQATVLIFVILVCFLTVPSSFVSDSTVESAKQTVRLEQGSESTADSLYIDLEKLCELQNKSAIASAQSLLFSPRLSTVYCPVFHAGSTLMKQSFLAAEGQVLRLHKLYNTSRTQAVHSQALSLSLKSSLVKNPEKLKDQLDTIILVARNPWKRLVSIYEDIIVKQKYFEDQCSSYERTSDGLLSFSGFMECLLHHANGTDLKALDYRLSPITRLCAVCQVPYNRILFYENLDKGMNYLGSLQRAQNIWKPESNILLSESLNYETHMQSLSRHTMDRVQQLYSLDFKAFGYKIV